MCRMPCRRHHHELRGRRGLVLELPHGKAVLWPGIGAPAIEASGSTYPWTKGACPRGLGRLPQRMSNRFTNWPTRNKYEVHRRRNRCITRWSRKHTVLEEYRDLARQG